MKRILIILFLLAFSSLIFGQEAVRTWTSQTGKTIIEAVWDNQDDSEPETVFFLKDGKRYKYPFEKLSDADQKFVADGRAKRARRGTESDPDLVLVDETPKPLTFGGFRLPTAKKFAVLIGVTDYVTMNDLKYTVRDVEAIRDQLLKIGFLRENVQMLTTGSDLANQPTQRNIQRAVKSALDQAKLGDLVFFAFSGHGAQVGDEVFFCPQDTIDEDISSTAVSITNVMADLSKSKADFKWLVVDACRNNPFRQRVAGVRSIQKIDDPPKGIALFQSCAQDEYSYEDDSVEHGLFTSNFVKGMQGAADSNNDGVLTFLEVCTYTTSQTVREVQQKFRANQRPYLSGNISDFVLMEDLNRPKAIACFNAARKLMKEKKYGEAKIQIEEALKLCPNTPEYLEERDIIQGFIELVSATPGGYTQPTPVGRVSETPGDIDLSPEFKPNLKQYEKLWEMKGESTRDIAVSRDGKYLAASSGNDINIRAFRTGEVLQTLKGHTDSVRSVSYSPDGRFIVSTGSWDETVRVWNTPTGECVKTLEHESFVSSVSYSPNGRFIASGSGDKTVRIWNAQTGECVKTLEGHESWVYSVSYSPDGRFIASGSGDNTIRIWNAQTGECVKTLEGHTDDVRSVSYSPDGRFIASGSGKYEGWDNTVRIWNAQTGECVKALLGHEDSVNSVSYSPDGRFIASGGGDETVRIWNTQTGEYVKTLQGNTSWVNSVSYSPDGKYLCAGARFGLTVWRAAE